MELTREYTLVHTPSGNWTSILLAPFDSHALVVRDDDISTVSADTAELILQWARQEPAYMVTELTGSYIS